MDTYTLVVLWNNGKRQEALEMADKDRESSRKPRRTETSNGPL